MLVISLLMSWFPLLASTLLFRGNEKMESYAGFVSYRDCIATD